MNTYIVKFTQPFPIENEQPEAFCCEADDEDHAVEQCLDAYPLHNIVEVALITSEPVELYEVLGGDGLADQPHAWHGNVQVYAHLIHAGQEALRDVVAEKIVFGSLPDDPDQAFYNLVFEETCASTDTGFFVGESDEVEITKVELNPADRTLLEPPHLVVTNYGATLCWYMKHSDVKIFVELPPVAIELQELPEPEIHAFNTGRMYTNNGQRIAWAVVEPGMVLMVDVDRRLDYYFDINDKLITDTVVLAYYDNDRGQYGDRRNPLYDKLTQAALAL